MGILGKDSGATAAPSSKTPWSSMWHRLKNFCSSLNTYKILSPDFKVRQQVNRALGDRTALSCEEWCAAFYHSHGITSTVAMFAYHHLEKYSGLAMSRVLPIDRLDKDLHWTAVCWFDWEAQLYQDIQQQFGIEMSECPLDFDRATIGELVMFLDQVARMVAPRHQS